MTEWLLTDEEILFLRDAADWNENKLLLGNTTILAEQAIAKAEAKKLVDWLERCVFHIDSRGYIALKPNATENWQTLCKEVLMNE